MIDYKVTNYSYFPHKQAQPQDIKMPHNAGTNN